MLYIANDLVHRRHVFRMTSRIMIGTSWAKSHNTNDTTIRADKKNDFFRGLMDGFVDEEGLNVGLVLSAHGIHTQLRV